MTTTEISGHLILLMAPSGSGKGQLIKHIKKEFPQIVFALTNTTREQRPNEAAGSSYCFISEQAFQNKIDNDDFVEWARYSDNFYGTPKSELFEPLAEGKIVLKEMESQGVSQVRKIIPTEHLTVIYVESGPWESLKKRIIARAPISEEHVEMRHQRYLEEIKMKPYADVVIENVDGKINNAKQQFTKIVNDIFKKVT